MDIMPLYYRFLSSLPNAQIKIQKLPQILPAFTVQIYIAIMYEEMPREVFKLFCYLHVKKTKLESTRSHFEFIENCCKSNLITKLLSYKSKVAFQTQEVRNFAHEMLDTALLGIQ